MRQRTRRVLWFVLTLFGLTSVSDMALATLIRPSPATQLPSLPRVQDNGPQEQLVAKRSRRSRRSYKRSYKKAYRSLYRSKSVRVKGYYRKDGKYVRPHTRSRPKR